MEVRRHARGGESRTWARLSEDERGRGFGTYHSIPIMIGMATMIKAYTQIEKQVSSSARPEGGTGRETRAHEERGEPGEHGIGLGPPVHEVDERDRSGRPGGDGEGIGVG